MERLPENKEHLRSRPENEVVVMLRIGEAQTCGRLHPPSPAVDHSHPLGDSHDRVLHDAVDRGRPVPARAAARPLERRLGEVRGPSAAGDPPEPAREVRPRSALVPAVRQLPERGRDARSRPFTLVSIHARHRHHQRDGAALVRARPARVCVGDPCRHPRRHPGRPAAGFGLRLRRPRADRARRFRCPASSSPRFSSTTCRSSSRSCRPRAGTTGGRTRCCPRLR